jgi:hypothetical protein
MTPTVATAGLNFLNDKPTLLVDRRPAGTNLATAVPKAGNLLPPKSWSYGNSTDTFTCALSQAGDKLATMFTSSRIPELPHCGMKEGTHTPC